MAPPTPSGFSRSAPGVFRLALFLGVLAACPGAGAQPAPVEPYWAAISGGEALMRSGEGDKFYPVARLKPGTLVRVEAEGAGWARAAYPPGVPVFVASDAVKPDPGAKTARLTRPTHVRAAKLDAAQAVGSWKPAVPQALAVGTTLTLLSPASLPDVGGKASYKVLAPEQCRGYVPTSSLIKATPEQVAAHLAGLRAQGITVAGGDPPVSGAAPAQAGPALADGAAAPQAPPAPREPTLAEKLEASFDAVRKQPVLDAELTELIAQYETAVGQMNDSPLTARTKAQMRQRLDYLRLQEKLQGELRAIEASKPKVGEDVTRASDRLKEVEGSRMYVVVGRLSASTLYDGKRLPLMYRVQSVGTLGRTLGYIKPTEALKLESKIGQIVGVVGESAIDSTLRLTMITPRRVDVLSPEPGVETEPSAPQPPEGG